VVFREKVETMNTLGDTIVEEPRDNDFFGRVFLAIVNGFKY
jgi:hypothetical protein